MVGMTVHALIDTRSVVAAEIAFKVAREVVAEEPVCNLQAQTRELRRGTEFGDTFLGRIVERYGAKVRCDVGLRIGRTKYILEVDESTDAQNRLADSERAQR
jgi:hypothetical protein